MDNLEDCRHCDGIGCISCLPKPAHIDTTAPVVLKPELQPDWGADEYTSRIPPKPAPQAEAQASFEQWFTDEWADKYLYGAEGPARDTWNAQQAKIEVLEQQLSGDLLYSRNKWHMLCNSMGWVPASTTAAGFIDAIERGQRESAELRQSISELEQQILLIQSNASANYSAAENRTHAVEEGLGVERLRSRMLGVVDGFKAAKSDKEKLREGK